MQGVKKFQIGDAVRITKGMYKDKEGVVRGYDTNTYKCIVIIGYHQEVRILSQWLEKKRQIYNREKRQLQ
uniref:KOW domain-containing protein n=1 Tax=viral metagenome TaxID=1070528 RepID=A0A6M3LGY0_9ZZZZ